MEVLNFKNVSKNYCNNNENLEVLKNINFTLKEGEIIAITGPSGSGKTTILNLISGLITPTIGSINSNGDIGYMFQKDHLFEWRTVYQNVILGLEIKKMLTDDNIERVNRMLDLYPSLPVTTSKILVKLCTYIFAKNHKKISIFA